MRLKGKNGKKSQRADELARAACALFGNLTKVLEDHYGERDYDYPGILLSVNAAVATLYRLKHQSPLDAADDFDRRAARSIATTLYDRGFIADQQAFYAAYLERSLATEAAAIEGDLEAVLNDEAEALPRLSATLRRRAAGGGILPEPDRPDDFNRDVEERLLLSYRWFVQSPRF